MEDLPSGPPARLLSVDVGPFVGQTAGAPDTEMTQASPTPLAGATAQVRRRPSTLSRAVALPALLLGSMVMLVLTYELSPGQSGEATAPFAWGDPHRDALLACLLSLVTLGLAGLWVTRRYTDLSIAAFRRVGIALLAFLTFIAGLAYFYGSHGSRTVYSHLHDSYHYLLGPKYYAELGYDALYACTAHALPTHQLPDKAPARDLATDRMTTVANLRGADTCRGRFSERRWDEFRHDLSVFTAAGRRTTRNVLKDRGYNGSPTHSVLASLAANSFSLSYAALSLVTLADVLSLCVMLAAICYAFELPLGLLSALLFFSQFVDRHLIIGNSFLRYQWLAALGVGIALLKRKRYGFAGAAIACSAWLNVFPALFAVPMLVKTLTSLIRTRKLPESCRRFWVGAATASVLCFAIGASGAGGLRNYRDFTEAMRVHNAAGRAPGFGVGIKYNFLPSDPDTGGSARAKASQLKELGPAILLCAALLLVWMLALLPHLDDVEAAVLCGFTGLFCIFGPTGYYYAFAAFLVLLWHRRVWDSGGIAMVGLLFASSIPPFVATLAGAHRYYVFNRVVSAAWTAYLICALGYLTWLRPRRSGATARSLIKLSR